MGGGWGVGGYWIGLLLLLLGAVLFVAYNDMGLAVCIGDGGSRGRGNGSLGFLSAQKKPCQTFVGGV